MTNSPNIVLLDRGSLSWDALDTEAFNKAFPHCTMYEHSADHEVAKRIKDAQIVLSNKGVISAEAIKGASQLQCISVLATGYNCVDLDAARKAGVTVCNVSGYSTPSVVQHVFMFITMLATSAYHYISDVKQGQWQKSTQFCLLDYPMHDIAGKTLGIIGYGNLGSKVAHVAESFGMNVMIAERKGFDILRDGRSAFDDVITQSDYITIHCPLNDDTHNMITRTELQAMQSSAFLINTARGGIVNEADLRDALLASDIAGAAVDVLSVEPPSQGNPLLEQKLDNLLITPHTAWAPLDAQQRLLDKTIGNIKAFLDGTPVNVVS